MKFDKCLICDEYFIKEKNVKNNTNLNGTDNSSSEDNEEIFLFKSENVDRNIENLNFKKSKNISKKNDEFIMSDLNRIRCPYCKCELHKLCFAENLLGDTIALIPKEGDCLVCSKRFKWSEFLIFKK